MTSLLRIQKLHYPPPVRHGKIYCFFLGLVKGSKKYHSKKLVTPDLVKQIEDSGSIEYLRGVFMSQPNICDQDFWQKRLLELFIEVKHVFTWVSPLSTNFRKWSNALKQFVGKLPTNCLSVFGHFVNLALKGLRSAFYKVFKKLIYRSSLDVFQKDSEVDYNFSKDASQVVAALIKKKSVTLKFLKIFRKI